jgi:hypothetical protein
MFFNGNFDIIQAQGEKELDILETHPLTLWKVRSTMSTFPPKSPETILGRKGGGAVEEKSLSSSSLYPLDMANPPNFTSQGRKNGGTAPRMRNQC